MRARWMIVLFCVALVALVAAGCGGDGGGGDGSSPDEALAADAVATSANGYEYEIVEVTEDATQAVLLENQFNDPPAEGRQFLIVSLRVTPTAEVDGPFVGTSSLRLLGPDNRIYTTFEDRCGVIPGRLEVSETPGSSSEGNLCWAVPSESVDELLLFEDASRGNTNYQELS